MEKKNVSILYHFDDDGKCAAGIAGYIVQHQYLDTNSENINYICASDYHKGKEYVDAVREGDLTIIVDFSLMPENMDALIEKVGLENIIWIDHHESGIDRYKDYPHEINGLRFFDKKNPKAGCELAWDYFITVPETPELIRMIGEWDTWRWADLEENEANRVLSFHFGLAGMFEHPEDYVKFFEMHTDRGYTRAPLSILIISSSSMKDFIDETIAKGEILEIPRRAKVKYMVENYGYEIDFKGYRTFVINGTEFSSLAFGNKIKEYDICIMYTFVEDHYKCSIYTDHNRTGIYANRICESIPFNGQPGGGHPGAAGFRTYENLFIKGEKKNV